MATLGALVVALLLATTANGPGAASSNVSVTMNVTSATTLDFAACPAASRSFGTVLPGTGAVTPACAIRFGSTNDTAALRLAQVDGRDEAMYRPFSDTADTGFAAGGTYSLDQSGGQDQFWNAVELPDNDILLVGRYFVGAGDMGTLLVRLNPDGTGHVGFGINGVSTFNYLVGSDDGVWGVDARSDGTAIVGINRPGGNTGLARILANGGYDPAWAGGAGSIDLPEAQLPRVVHVLQDNRILVGGSDFWPVVDCTVTRMTSGGLVDNTYGVAGSRHVMPAGANCDGMAVDRDGRAILAGNSGADSVLVRLDVGGAVDPTFGGGVRVFDPPEGAASSLYEAAIRPDGGVIVGGDVGGQLWLQQYKADGTTDGAFSGDGSLAVPGEMWDARHITYMDGRITVVGAYGQSRIVRLNVDGSFDNSFSLDGRDNPTVPAETDSEGLLVLGDGRALLYGHDAGTTIAQARMYDAESVPNHSNTSFDWNDGTGFFGACVASVTAPGAATWGSGACAQSDGAMWNDVPQYAETVATAPSGNDTIVATLHFGVRVPTAQAPGSYVAPVRVEVLAPAI